MKLQEVAPQVYQTKDGHEITTYFETNQGSKYLLSDKNESKRIKSFHANTGGEDQGVKGWMENCVFVPNKEETMANAFMLMHEKFKAIAVKSANGTLTFVVYDGKWRDAVKSDAFPKSFKDKPTDGPLSFSYTKTPTMGYNVCEFNLNGNKTVASWHLGSPVSKIQKISELSKDEIMAFSKG